MTATAGDVRKLGPFTVSSIGLGCMNLSHAYGIPPAPDIAAEILLRALDLGVTHFDTATLYGFGANEELLGPALATVISKTVSESDTPAFDPAGKSVGVGTTRLPPNALMVDCRSAAV